MGKSKEVIRYGELKMPISDRQHIEEMFSIKSHRPTNFIVLSNPENGNWLKKKFMEQNDNIKDSVLETNSSICEHKKDCCHPWCACGVDAILESKTSTLLCEKVKAEHYTPLDRYNKLIAARNRKVERGIPLSYGK